MTHHITWELTHQTTVDVTVNEGWVHSVFLNSDADDKNYIGTCKIRVSSTTPPTVYVDATVEHPGGEDLVYSGVSWNIQSEKRYLRNVICKLK